MSRSRPRIALTTRIPVTQAGGIESTVREIAPRLAARRSRWEIRTISAFSRVSRWNRIPLLGDLVAGLLLAGKTSRFDVVLINGAEYAWPRMLRRGERARTIVVWHGTRVGEIPALVPKMSPAVKLYHALETWLQGWALRAGGNIAVSSSTLAEIRAAYRGAGRVTIVPNGAPDLGGLPRGGSPGGHRVAWTGTSPYKKGLDIALAACERTRERYPDLELIIIGPSTLASTMAERNWVRPTGRLDHAASLEVLRSADVFLATSRYEGCSVAVVEALALGLPVVAAPSVAWMTGGGGIAVNGFAVEGYADALCALFASPPLRESMSQAARSRARDFDWDDAADAYVQEIETCLRAS